MSNKFLEKDIVSIHKDLVNAKLTSKDLISESIECIKHDDCNMYEKDNFKGALKASINKTCIDPNKMLDGLPYVLKDNFSTKGIESTASSNILNGYVPLYDSTVFTKLKKAGAIMVSKTSMDELAMGGTGTTSHKGATLNPIDKSRIIGGSSSGSCASVLSNHCFFSIGSDTGDSVRKPASYAGIYGFKPSYGLVSRYGLFAFAQSLDTVGYFTKTLVDSAILTEILAGYDKNDFTSYKGKYDKDFVKSAQKGTKKKYKLCYIPQIIESMKDDFVKKSYYSLIEKLQNKGIVVDKIEFSTDLLNAIYPTYMIISCAEASSNNACLDGVRYGQSGPINASSYKEQIIEARTKGFSDMIKRRFVIGSYSLLSDNKEEVFIRAQKARRLIVNRVLEIFKDYQGLLLPATEHVAPKLSEVDYSWSKEPNFIENHMAIGNFGGFPSITMPWIKKDNLPIGINLTCPLYGDSMLFAISKDIDETIKEEN